MYLPVEYYRSP